MDKLNDNFWRWFGDSVTVDKNGNPLIFYHGTKQKFDTFKAKYDDKLIFFAYDEEFARDWAKSAPLTDEQKQIDTDLYFDKVVPYSNAVNKKLNAKYGSEYSEDKYKESRKRIDRYENRLKKQAGLDDKVIPVYIKARKIFVPERDYELVLKDIIDYYNWADPTTPEYKEKLQRVTDNFNQVNAVEKEWFKNNPDASDEEDKKHQHNIDYAYKFLAAQRSIKDSFDYHLDRIKTGAWAYFEHQVIIDKIFDELGFDAIQLSERQGKPTTLAVREGTDQIKSIYATEFKDTSNIYETNFMYKKEEEKIPNIRKLNESICEALRKLM